jgi:hypothetical protein
MRGGALVLLAWGSAAAAQSVTGVVRDSTTRLPIPGVVVELRAAADSALGRTLTNNVGEFRLPAAPGGGTLKAQRIGFRAVAVPVRSDSLGAASLSVTMVRLPTMLDKVDVVAGAKCDRRANSAGQAFIQQARAGLLATLVGREANPAKLVRLSYERTYGLRLDTVPPEVRIDSVNEATTAFRAARRGADLVRRGFTADSNGTGVYFSPDAEVLLDDGFEAGYCFYVTDRPDEVGLGFYPAASRRFGRADVEGTLWIDEKARALRSLEYRYVGVGAEAESRDVGGTVEYQEMPNGVVLATRWTLRLLKVQVDSAQFRYSRLPTGRIVVSEAGGMIARAEWPDGTAWVAGLGTLEVTAVDSAGRRLPRATVRLRGTDYVAVADDSGVARFTSVFPGRYFAEVVNPELDAFGFAGSARSSNVGSLDSALARPSNVRADTTQRRLMRSVDVSLSRVARVVAPMMTTAQFARAMCETPSGTPRRAILGQVVDTAGRGADRAVIRTDLVSYPIIANSNGAFVTCAPLERDKPVHLVAGSGFGRSEDTTLELRSMIEFIRLVIRP